MTKIPGPSSSARSTARRSEGLEGRSIPGSPTEWYTFLPELSPMLIRQRLYAGMFGSYGEAYDLFLMMQDTSPRLFVNLHEVRENASQVELQVVPFSRLNEEPTAEASERAGFIDWALQQFDPDYGTDEVGLDGLGYDILASLIQLSVTEIMYQRVNGYWVPRAGAWVNPRKYAIAPSGRVGVSPTADISTDARYVREFTPNKFIIANYKTHSGAATMSGLFRPLAPWWGMSMFGRKWMFDFAQRYGLPIPVVPYKPGIKPEDKKALEDYCKNFAANSYFMYPWNGSAEGKPEMWETKREAKDTPMAWLKAEFDFYCDLVVLGEARMSETGRISDKGSTQQAAALKKVKNDRIRCIANFRAQVIQNTLVKWLLLLNYGNTDECPTIQSDVSESMDPLQQATMYLTYRQAGYKLEIEDLKKETNLPLVEVALITEATPPNTSPGNGATPQPPKPGAEDPNKPANNGNGSGKPKDDKNGKGKNGNGHAEAHEFTGMAAEIMRKRGFIAVAGESTEEDRVAARARTDTNPTDEQKKSGEYQKGKFAAHGLSFTLENPAGSTRSGVSGDGEPWSCTLPCDYGYIDQTEGADGDEIDVFVGPDIDEGGIWIIDQNNADSGEFDEHKVMFGFPTEDSATTAYDASFSDGKGPQRRGDKLSKVTLPALKEFLGHGVTKGTRSNAAVTAQRAGRRSSRADSVHDRLTSRALKDYSKAEAAALLPILQEAEKIAAINDDTERRDAARKFKIGLPSALTKLLNEKAGVDGLVDDITAAFFNGMAETAKETTA